MDDRIVSVLVADSRTHARSAIRLLLAQEPDIVVVGETADVEAAVVAIAACRPEVVLLDWELPRRSLGQSCDSAVAAFRVASPESFVIALSGRPEASRSIMKSTSG